MTEEDMQAKAMQFGIMQKDIENISVMVTNLEQKKLEINNTISALKGLQKESKILVPVGPGLFLPGSLEANSKPLIDIGANIILEKEADEAGEMLQKNIKELEKAQEDLGKEHEKIIKKIQSLEAELVKMYQKAEKKDT